MAAGNNSELTRIKGGAFSLVACTEFPEHPSSPSISKWPTWQHSVCPHLFTVAKMSAANAYLVRH
jgi:hypothetical protein